MKRLFLVATAVVFLAGRVSSARDKYTFGEVPPPSPFAGEVDYQGAVPAAPKAVPVPAPTSTNTPVAEPAKPVPAAPAVASPKPVVKKVGSVKPKSGTRLGPQPASRTPSQWIIEPGGGLNGKVMMADERGRFVVLNFPLGQMPAPDMALTVYRHGVKVGEIKVTGPQRDDNTVADVVSGELQAGDVARNR